MHLSKREGVLPGVPGLGCNKALYKNQVVLLLFFLITFGVTPCIKERRVVFDLFYSEMVKMNIST